ncbi:MAG: CinA family protein, partial [Paludibacteraceae bacterium]|nr:CinA family protein [Paludibacteraceae bacterium]
VVEQMATGVRQKMNTHYAIATSGIAGPDGGTPDKPVGTTWIAVATPDRVISKKFQFGKLREQNINRATQAALTLLIQLIKHDNFKTN